MKNFLKLVTLLCIGIAAASSEEMVFDGPNTLPNDYVDIRFEEGNGTYKITKVSMKNNDKLGDLVLDLLPSGEESYDYDRGFKEITVIIPAEIQGKQVCIGEEAFKDFGVNVNNDFALDPLRMNLKFTRGKNGETVELPDNCSRMFFNARGITEIDLSGANSSNVYNVREMFEDCCWLRHINFQSFKTSDIQDMSKMFKGCVELTSIDLKKFDTANVTNMKEMFAYCRRLTNIDLCSFDVKNVTDNLNFG